MQNTVWGADSAPLSVLVLEIPGDALRGMGEFRLPMLIVIVNLCLPGTALLFLIVPRWPDVRGIAVCDLITWAVTDACMMVCWLKRLPKCACQRS